MPAYEDAPAGGTGYPGTYEPPECDICGRPAVEVEPDGPRCDRHASGMVI